MRRLWLIAGTLVLLASCAILDKAGRLPEDAGFDPKLVRAPRPTEPNVFVVDGYLVVDQEPIRIWRRDTVRDVVTIGWALPAGTSFVWAERAITFRPEPANLKCGVRPQGKILLCTYSYESKKQYKYTLNAMDGKTPLPALDPFIVNME